MSEPVVFALVRDGTQRFFADRWAAVFLFRELLWGPTELETWVTQLTEIEAWDEDCCAGVVVDYDRRKLLWFGENQPLNIPRSWSVYSKLLATAWKDFDVQFAAEGAKDLAHALGREWPYEGDEDDSQYRPATARIAGFVDEDLEEDDGYPDEFDEDEDLEGGYGSHELDEDYEFDEDEERAWVTLLYEQSTVRHRQLSELSEDIVHAKPSALKDLKDLPAAEVPPEKVVTEGCWIDESQRQIGLWGNHTTKRLLPLMQASWSDWDVQWIDKGYQAQCSTSGPSGIPMSDAEALARFLPIVLSNKRFDMNTIVGAIGGNLKKTAIKAVGCLWIVVCLPLLIFGAVSGNWTAVLITVAIVGALFFGLFKVLETKFKRSFTKNLPGGEEADNKPPTAGPQEPSQRRTEVERLLAAAGLPPLLEIEPHFGDLEELSLLGG